MRTSHGMTCSGIEIQLVVSETTKQQTQLIVPEVAKQRSVIQINRPYENTSLLFSCVLQVNSLSLAKFVAHSYDFLTVV